MRASSIVTRDRFQLAEGLQVGVLGVAVLVEQGLAAGTHSERPGRSGGQRPLGQGFVRGGRRLPVAGQDGRLDHFRQ